MVKRVFVLISLVVAILVIGKNAFAQDETSNIPHLPLSPGWEFVAMKLDGSTFYVNTRLTTYLPGGIVEVPIREVPRGEDRGKIVNLLRLNLLSKGEDPSEAERLWYIINLDEVNCKTNQIATQEVIAYSFEKTLLDDISFQYPFRYEKWHRIPPWSAREKIENYVCKEKRGLY